MAYIGIDRGVRNHWIYQDSEYFHVWFEMIACARFTEGVHRELIEGELVEVEYGEFIYGRISWSDRLGVSQQRLRTLISKLIKDDMLELRRTYRKSSVYRLKNFQKFNHQSNQLINQQRSLTHQVISGDTNQQTNHHINQQPTSNQPAANHIQELKELNTLSSASATKPEFENLDEVHKFIFGHYQMSGVLSGFIVKYKGKGFTDSFIREVLLEAAETCNNGKPNIRQIEAIAERWERDHVYSRAQSKTEKVVPISKAGQAPRARQSYQSKQESQTERLMREIKEGEAHDRTRDQEAVFDHQQHVSELPYR